MNNRIASIGKAWSILAYATIASIVNFMRATIFQKVRLCPSQLRTVANRRFEDADALCGIGKNIHANGAIYIGGFVIECLLKAKLLERFPWLQNARLPQERNRNDQYIWSLCYRSHDLDEILAKLPEIITRLSQLEQRGSDRLVQALKSICSQWTIYARYSPYNADIDDARIFLDQIKELKSWLV
jgi:hypothetical protein